MDEDDRNAKPDDSDRAAILARRRRFIALAISGLATAGCKRPSPQPCLDMVDPSEREDPDDPEATPSEPGPFVEDPGEPVDGETGETGGEQPDIAEEPRPEVCLKMAAPPQPQPCLKKSRPQPCLLMID